MHPLLIFFFRFVLKILRKKEHRVKELCLQSEEDHKNVSLLQESCDKLNEKVKVIELDCIWQK
jgi:hypothetical protein